MHFRDTLGGQDADDLRLALDTRANANMFNMMDANCQANTCDIIPLDGSSAGTTKNLANWHGTGTQDNVPAQAVIVSLKTGLRSRRARGRVYVPFVTEANNANGFIDGTFRAALESGWDNFRAGMATDNFEWVVASYVGSVANTITNVTVSAKLGTQRRRQSRL
jgi:hypothetical protein